MPLSVVVMAGGMGKRMFSKKVKVLHPLLGRPMLDYVVDTARGINPDVVVVVYGKKGQEIRGRYEGVRYAFQEEPRGTGDAVKVALKELNDINGDVLVLSGDVPLIKKNTLLTLVDYHRRNKLDATLLTCEFDDPTGYGRIIRDGEVIKGIVEEADATPEIKKIREINTGIYVFRKDALESALLKLKPDNVQGEYYLTDVIGIFVDEKRRVGGVKLRDKTEIKGVNTRKDLAEVEEILRQQKLESLMLSGVRIIMPHTVYIEEEVEIGKDTVIYPFTIIKGKTKIGEDCRIGPFAVLDSCEVRDGEKVP